MTILVPLLENSLSRGSTIRGLCGGAFPFRTFLFIVALHLCASVVAAGSLDERFIDGLQQRRLFTLAEKFCRQRLADQQLTDTDRAALTAALCRTLAQHAIHSPRNERQALWEAAEQAVVEFQRNQAGSPRLILVQMQRALTVLARGELARQEAEVGAAGAPSLEEARQELSEAATLLRDLSGQAQRQLRGRRGDEALSENELMSLERNIRFQLARAYRNQALCYAPASDERAHALLQAEELLTPLTKLDTQDSLIWNSRVDEITCLRLHGKLREAAARLGQKWPTRPPSKIQLLLRAEHVRILLAAGRAEEALDVLKGREIAGQTSAELDLAHVETFIALWKRATENNNAQEAQLWQDRAAGVVQVMESLYGPYWTRRGEALLAKSASAGGSSANVDVLVRTAASLYRRQEFDDAVLAYERAGNLALQSGDSTRAFDLLYTASVIEQRRQRLAEALARQQRVAMQLPREPKAPLVHLQAVLNAAQLARDGTSQSLDRYRQLLGEHLTTWPNDESTAKARLWLGRMQEHERKWEAARETYQEISAQYEQQFFEGVQGTARSYQELLRAERAAGRPTDELAEQAARYFERIILGPDNRWPERWSPLAREAAIDAARIRLTYGKAGFDTAKTFLETALRFSADAPADWKLSARSLLVVAQAGAGDRAGAQQTLRQVSDGSPAGQLEILAGLANLAQDARPEVRRELAALQLDVLAVLRPQRNALAEEDRIRLELMEAEALYTAGKSDAARAAFQKLIEQHPDNGSVQRQYGLLLLESNDRPTLEAARDQWRNILRRSRPQTPAWFEAKYSLALSHFRLGERQQAARMIELTQTLHPNLGGPEWKRRFESLLSQTKE